MPKEKEYKLAFVPLTVLKREHSIADQYDILIVSSKEKPILGCLLKKEIAPPVDTRRELPFSFFLEKINVIKEPIKVVKKGKKRGFVFFPSDMGKNLEDILMQVAYVNIISS